MSEDAWIVGDSILLIIAAVGWFGLLGTSVELSACEAELDSCKQPVELDESWFDDFYVYKCSVYDAYGNCRFWLAIEKEPLPAPEPVVGRECVEWKPCSYPDSSICASMNGCDVNTISCWDGSCPSETIIYNCPEFCVGGGLG